MRLMLLLLFLVSPLKVAAQFEPSGGPGTSPSTVPAPPSDAGPQLHFQATEEYRTVTPSDANHYGVAAAAAPNPTTGPQEPYTYTNSRGYFKIPDYSSVNGGKAQYTWMDGSQHVDRLTYISHGYVTETQGHYVPPGTKVSVWAFRAEDASGNHFFLYFGTDPIINAPQGARYPMYYSYGPPGPAPTFRFLSQSGTTRQ